MQGIWHGRQKLKDEVLSVHIIRLPLDSAHTPSSSFGLTGTWTHHIEGFTSFSPYKDIHIKYSQRLLFYKEDLWESLEMRLFGRLQNHWLLYPSFLEVTFNFSLGDDKTF